MNKVSSLYIHFPFCRHLCNYCDFYKHKLNQEKQVDEFEKLLLTQIQEHKKLLKQLNFEMKTLETLYIGGGTPSLWSSRGSEFLKANFLDHVLLDRGTEFTIEVDPGTWTMEEIEKWLAIGVNRFSIGVQSFDEDYLKILDRAHTQEEVLNLLDYLKSIKANYSVDLMLGLPVLDNKARDVVGEINELMKFAPCHFSVYILKCRKNYPHLDLLPDDDQTADEYLAVCQHLQKMSYEQYEVSNFALKGKESLHNKKYWQYKSVAALGPNATGLFIINQNESLRYQWKATSGGFVTEKLTGTSLKIEKLYMQLRARNCFDASILGEENQDKMNHLLDLWFQRGYVAPGRDTISLTPQGYLMLDSLMDDIFKCLTL